MILIKVTNLSEGFVMVGRRQWDPLGDVLSLVSFYVIHRLFFVAPESSNVSLVSGLPVHLCLLSARSLLVFSATVWQIKAAQESICQACSFQMGLTESQVVSVGPRAVLMHVLLQ